MKSSPWLVRVSRSRKDSSRWRVRYSCVGAAVPIRPGRTRRRLRRPDGVLAGDHARACRAVRIGVLAPGRAAASSMMCAGFPPRRSQLFQRVAGEFVADLAPEAERVRDGSFGGVEPRSTDRSRGWGSPRGRGRRSPCRRSVTRSMNFPPGYECRVGSRCPTVRIMVRRRVAGSAR